MSSLAKITELLELTYGPSFSQLLEAVGGQEAGKMEIDSTKLKDALAFMIARGIHPKDELPKFEEGFLAAQKTARKGWRKRKDMPVIDSDDVKILRKRLEGGTVDHKPPFAKDTDPKNLFPQGLKDPEAKIWLKRGIKKNDGDADDDRIKVSEKGIKVKNLLPIQEQIYADKSMLMILDNGVKPSYGFYSSKHNKFIVSGDNYIIDGHHRWLASMLIDRDIVANCLVIDLPIKKLLDYTLAYGDAIGNTRNA